MRYKHVLFDLDRTLWDFNRNNTQTLNELFLEFNLEKRCNCSFESFFNIYTVINNTLWEECRQGRITKEVLIVKRFYTTLDYFGVKDFADISEISEYYLNQSPKKKHLLPFALELLEYLHAKGYIMHVITNGFKEVQYTKLKSSGIDSFFTNVFISEEIGFYKPDKRIFNYVLFKLNELPEKCIMIGDDFRVDILGARSANIDAIFLDEEKSKHVDDIKVHHVTSLSEIKEIL